MPDTPKRRIRPTMVMRTGRFSCIRELNQSPDKRERSSEAVIVPFVTMNSSIRTIPGLSLPVQFGAITATDNIRGTFLHFHVNSSQIFPDDTYTHKLDATKEQDGYQERGVSGYVHAKEYCP